MTLESCNYFTYSKSKLSQKEGEKRAIPETENKLSKPKCVIGNTHTHTHTKDFFQMTFECKTLSFLGGIYPNNKTDCEES